MRAGFPTGTHISRSFEEAHPLIGRCVCLAMRDCRFYKTLCYVLKLSFELPSFVTLIHGT
jgi:hypothetical protein